MLVAEALDALPDDLAAAMDNVAVLVEDWPTDEQQGDSTEPILGLYEGVALTERSIFDTVRLPDRITLFRGPLCDAALDEDDLVEQVLVTVVHEVAHHFGIDDDRLDELGWA
ncbi:MAG TPA: metallopeptidase family protein [Acidimicrobiia bacterium]|nr:metallopeptidase family protein [Acidimicrobiia bacterium]